MKNYLKLIIAVFGITLATFGSIPNMTAQREVGDLSGNNVVCKGSGDCGYTPDCQPIIGTQVSNPH
jgi:hypothetical protein